MNAPYTPDSDRPDPLEGAPRTVGDELAQEARSLGSTLQLFLRLRWWLAAVSAIVVVAWKAQPMTAAPASTSSGLEARVAGVETKVDGVAGDVHTLVMLACLQYGPTSTEIVVSNLKCPTMTVPDHTTTPRIRR